VIVETLSDLRTMYRSHSDYLNKTVLFYLPAR